MIGETKMGLEKLFFSPFLSSNTFVGMETNKAHRHELRHANGCQFIPGSFLVILDRLHDLYQLHLEDTKWYKYMKDALSPIQLQ